MPFGAGFVPLPRPRGGNVALPHAPVVICVLISADICPLVVNTCVVCTTVATVATTAPPPRLTRGLPVDVAPVMMAVLGTLLAMLLCQTLVDMVSVLVVTALAFRRGMICSMSRSESRIRAVIRLWA